MLGTAHVHEFHIFYNQTKWNLISRAVNVLVVWTRGGMDKHRMARIVLIAEVSLRWTQVILPLCCEGDFMEQGMTAGCEGDFKEKGMTAGCEGDIN